MKGSANVCVHCRNVLHNGDGIIVVCLGEWRCTKNNKTEYE
jgi:hypothetical protein